MGWPAYLVPSLSIALATAIAALPWGLSSGLRFILPHLPYVAVHYWTLRRPERVPEAVVFAAGLTLDVLTNGPLGFWALIYLIGYVVAGLQSPWAGEGRIMRWLLLLSALIVLAVGEWGLASLYYLELADWRPFAVAAMLVSLAYPLIAFVLSLLGSNHKAEAMLFSERGS